MVKYSDSFKQDIVNRLNSGQDIKSVSEVLHMPLRSLYYHLRNSFQYDEATRTYALIPGRRMRATSALPQSSREIN